MAITTLDGALAGMQASRFFTKGMTGNIVAGRPLSTWGLNGFPGPGGYDTTLNGVVVSAATPGALDFVNPSSGNTYLARLLGSATVGGTLILADRLWHNGGLSSTSLTTQFITSPTWPPRDRDGLTAGTGVYIGAEISALTGSGTPTLTMSYTNSAGDTARTATNITSTTSAASTRTFYQLGLQGGDQGVRSVQSITLSSSWTSGTFNLVAYREISRLDIATGSTPVSMDLLSGGFQRIYNDSALFFIFVPAGSTTSAITGQLTWTQG